MVLWVALAGPESLWVGAGFAALGVLAGAWLVPGEPHAWRPLRLVGFAAYFVRESWNGGVDVARRAFDPALPIAPALVEHRLRLAPGMAQTAFVCICSLLPGTLSVAVHPERDLLLVHALSPDAASQLDVLEERIAWLFAAPLPPQP